MNYLRLARGIGAMFVFATVITVMVVKAAIYSEDIK